MNLFKDIHKNALDEKEITAKLKSSKQKSVGRENTTGFAFEDSNGKIVKVFVKRDQAEDFEHALSRMQLDDDGEKREIPEILFDLRKYFDIVDVEWEKGSIPEDEEVNNELTDQAGEESQGDDLAQEVGGEDPLDAELNAADGMGSENDAYSALQKVIDMLTANAEAEKAKAEAEKAKAEAEIAKTANSAAEMRAKQEEEILDMEEYNKRKKEEEEIRNTRDKLIKYRHELNHSSNLGESMDKNCKYEGPTQEEEELLDMEKWEEEERERAKAEKTRERLNRFRHEKKQVRKQEQEEMRARIRKYLESEGMESVKELTFEQFIKLNK